MEKTGCKIICGAPTTLAVKELMMMMMIMMMMMMMMMMISSLNHCGLILTWRAESVCAS